jgi:hypothetical protein
MMKYYVVSRFYDSGAVEAEMVLESEYNHRKHREYTGHNYDQYCDTFPSYEKALKFLNECDNA